MQPPPQQTDLMRSLVEKYSDFPSPEERPPAGAADGHVVVSYTHPPRSGGGY